MDFTRITDELYTLISTEVFETINERQFLFTQQQAALDTRQLSTFDHLDAATELINRQTAEMQRQVELLFRRALPVLLPEAALWFKADSRPLTDWIWVISPYTYELMGPAIVSIALQRADTLTIGMLVNLSTGELLTGVAGEGCRMDDTIYLIEPRTLPTASRSMLFLPPSSGNLPERGLGAGRWSDRIAAFNERYGYPLKTNNVAGNAAHYLSLLARNEVDFVVGVRFDYHDIAAGICLVEQAGGLVTDFEGGKSGLYSGDSFFAGPADIHRQFMQTKT